MWGFCWSGGELPDSELAGVSICLMVNCLGFCLLGDELSGVSVCPSVNSLMVNCLGFCLSGGRLSGRKTPTYLLVRW